MQQSQQQLEKLNSAKLQHKEEKQSSPIRVYYVETEQKLKEAYAEWENAKELGIDIECENNLHHYGAYISIVQISSKEKNWVVDLIKMRDVSPLIDMLKNDKIIKIFHDVSFDFRILQHQLGCKPCNVFDTQLAALLLGKKDIGLGSLLEEYFKISKESKFQMADWTLRPLTPEMLLYAVKDTNKLIELKALLLKELEAKGRSAWIAEECRNIEKSDYEYKEGDFFDIKGVSRLTNQERAILKKLFDLREFMAKKVNRPVHFILSTKRMMELAKLPPSFKEWESMKGVHPIVRAKAKLIFEEIEKSKRAELPMPKTPPKKFYSQKQKEEFEKYNLLRDEMATRLGLEKHMILSKDQIRDIVVTGKMDSLSGWQKILVEAELKSKK